MSLTLLPLLLATTIAPVITFTSDSVYEKDNVLTTSVKVEEDESLTLILEPKNLIGYEIYDSKDTEYIDGIKVNDEFVTNWEIKNYDPSKELEIVVKTVYTDDFAGMCMAAKDGDWSKLLSNPVTLLMAGYYIIASISVVVGALGALSSKKKKVKTTDEINSNVNSTVKTSFTGLSTVLIAKVITFLETFGGSITESFNALQANQIKLLQCVVLMGTDRTKGTLMALDLLENLESSNISEAFAALKQEILLAQDAQQQAKEKATEAINQIISTVNSTAKEIEESNIQEDDGTSI